jgi:uncharacterized membrane protein YidH (DUF202 family)
MNGIAFAQGKAVLNDTVEALVARIAISILNPIIYLLFAVALLIFIKGLVEFLANRENASERQKGRMHMIWGVIGLFIMFAAFTIINLITNTFHLDPAMIP